MFETALREWRTRRGMSQMALAMAADVSARHVSFLESARSRPSPAMVLRLAEALDLPLRERNGLLVAAGFAPHFGDSDWQSAKMAELRQASQLLLRAHSPYPALVLNAALDILEANGAALALIGVEMLPEKRLNLADLVFSPGAVRASIVNWEEVARYMVHRLREGARRRGPESPVARVLRRVQQHEGVERLNPRPEGHNGQVLLPLEFEIDGQITRWFTTVTSFGAPQDALAEEIAIEQFHPA